jgi:two-component system sensor histidine kinase MtrB
LRRRLIVAFVLVAGVSTAALALGSYLLVMRARFDESLGRASADVRYQLVLARQFAPLDAEHRANLLASFEGSGRRVVLVTEDGATPSNSTFNAMPDATSRSTAAAGQIAYQRVNTDAEGHLLLVGGRIQGTAAELYVGYAEEAIYRDLAQLRTVLFAGWIAVLLLAALVGRVLARRTLEPIGTANQAARAIAEGLLATRLPVKSRDEFGAWAESFNAMAEALEAKIAALSNAEARERRFTADVAHELRTPVTALVAAASLLRDHLPALPVEAQRPAQLLVNDVVRLRHLVDELMEISRLDAGQEGLSIQATELAGLVRAIVEIRGWQAKVDVSGEAVTVDTDPRRLERILANLLANALEHGGGQARVLVSGQGPGAIVRVSDSGPGIAAQHLPRIFERFYKADPARSSSGSGLGLAIAYENARLLGVGIEVWSQAGAGTWFEVRLPVAQRLPAGEAGVWQAGDRPSQDTSEEGPS